MCIYAIKGKSRHKYQNKLFIFKQLLKPFDDSLPHTQKDSNQYIQCCYLQGEISVTQGSEKDTASFYDNMMERK